MAGPDLSPRAALVAVILAHALPVAGAAGGVAQKLLGVAVSVGTVVVVGHALFRVHTPEQMAVPLDLLAWRGLVPVVVAPVWPVDGRQTDPHDDSRRLAAILASRTVWVWATAAYGLAGRT